MFAYIIPAIQIDYLYGFWPAIIALVVLFIFFRIIEWIWITLATPDNPNAEYDDSYPWLYRVQTLLTFLIILCIGIAGGEYCTIDTQNVEHCVPFIKRFIP